MDRCSLTARTKKHVFFEKRVSGKRGVGHDCLHGFGFGFRRRGTGAPRDAPWAIGQNGSFVLCMRHHSGAIGGQISAQSVRKAANIFADVVSRCSIGERALRYPSGKSHTLMPMRMAPRMRMVVPRA